MSIVYVANVAGVSKATVSRVINGLPGVGSDTAKLVRDVMERVGYEPPAIRRGPKLHSRRKKRHGSIVLLMGGHDPAAVYSMPVFPSLLKGIERALAEQDRGLILAGLRPDGQLPASLEDDSIDGLLLFGDLETRLAPSDRLRLEKFPAVWLVHDHGSEIGNFDRVIYNNAEVGRMAAKYLLSRGHRNVAYVNAIPEHGSFVIRQSTFGETIRREGGTVIELVSEKDRNPMLLRMQALANDLLVQPARPTALFVPSDVQLLALYMGLQSVGITPGKDVDIIGCDNERSVIDQLHPTPATIDINWGLVGRQGVRQLLWRARHRDEPGRVCTVVDPFLVLPSA